VKSGRNKKAIFELFSLGISTNRDEWVTDFSRETLIEKIKYFSEFYNNIHKNNDVEFTNNIKWSEQLKRNRFNNHLTEYSDSKIQTMEYRPYTRVNLYNESIFIDRLGQSEIFFSETNSAIVFRYGDRMDFFTNAVKSVPNLNYYSLDPVQCVPLHYYKNGTRIDNITDWGLNQFTKHYKTKRITKEDIFHYVYGVLHHPAYRAKYELNLKREFPRVPFYDDFAQWSAWGKRLMELHIGYESVEPFGLERVTTDTKLTPKPKLKADKAAGAIILDENTTLTGIPAAAWEYKLGNRSALEWILDQYKESKPKDPTIAEKFNTYKFSDYKEVVVDLLDRVCRVSVETMAIIEEMKAKEK